MPFSRLEVDIHTLTDRKLRQDFVLLSIVVILGPAGFEHNSTLEGKLFKLPHFDFDFALFGYTFLSAENCDKTAEYG